MGLYAVQVPRAIMCSVIILVHYLTHSVLVSVQVLNSLFLLKSLYLNFSACGDVSRDGYGDLVMVHVHTC